MKIIEELERQDRPITTEILSNLEAMEERRESADAEQAPNRGRGQKLAVIILALAAVAGLAAGIVAVASGDDDSSSTQAAAAVSSAQDATQLLGGVNADDNDGGIFGDEFDVNFEAMNKMKPVFAGEDVTSSETMPIESPPLEAKESVDDDEWMDMSNWWVPGPAGGAPIGTSALSPTRSPTLRPPIPPPTLPSPPEQVATPQPPVAAPEVPPPGIPSSAEFIPISQLPVSAPTAAAAVTPAQEASAEELSIYFSLRITTEDFNSQVSQNRANFGSTVFSATFDQVQAATANAQGARITSQSLGVGFNWRCEGGANGLCPPETEAIAELTVDVNLVDNSVLAERDTVIESIIDAFSDARVLERWVNFARADGIEVTSVASYFQGGQIGLYTFGMELPQEETPAVPSAPQGATSPTNAIRPEIVCQLDAIHVHLVAPQGESFHDYRVRPLLVEATHPYFWDALDSVMRDTFLGLYLSVPGKGKERRLQGGERELRHISGHEYDVRLIARATVLGDEAVVCNQVRDLVQQSLSSNDIGLWVREVNLVGLPLAQATAADNEGRPL